CFYDKFRTTRELCVTDADVVVTEDPYLGSDAKKYNSRGYVNTFKKLCFAVGMISVIATVLEAEFVLVKPVDWKSFYSLTKDTPETIRETIRAHLIGAATDPDIQDAILIGRYYIDHAMIVKQNP
ncbi:MAG: hypothetical protein JXQ30_08795, partial [Spirochaetes bacterium]|nr:hypothetical protein [Spirochaetota bacterium]